MNVSAFISNFERLHGSGRAFSYKGLDASGNQVVLKCQSAPDDAMDLFIYADSDGSTGADADANTFKVAIQREADISAKLFPGVAGVWHDTDEGGCYIRPWLKHNLGHVVDFKQRLQPAQLKNWMLSILDALQRLQAETGTGHGNLSLNNVLLPALDASKVYLVDFAVADEANAARDKRALGWMLYQLLTNERRDHDEGFPVLPSDLNLGFLGSSAQFWRNFCNTLLAGGVRTGSVDWDALKERVARHAGSGGKSRLSFSVLAALLALCVGIGVWWHWQDDSDTVVVDRAQIEAQWLELVDNFF
ncbi:MAG: hypothetical protein LR015_06135 [Verrucomicrobia bacterium]|nr:hypothetical protein [Verrucomicrobiota bacterium]